MTSPLDPSDQANLRASEPKTLVTQVRHSQTPALRKLRRDVLISGLICAVAISLFYVLLIWLTGGNPFHRPAFAGKGDTPGIYLDVAKSALGLAAAVGAVLALVVGYRRHLLETAQSHREDERLSIDRFQAAAKLLGDESPAVRLSGVYAMAQLADDWDAQRQVCIDVLCAYVRMPYDPEDPSTTDEKQVRQTVMRVIGTRLRSSPGWQGHDFDFSGALIDSADFSDAIVTGGVISFSGTRFRGHVSFSNAKFLDGVLNFSSTSFESSMVMFNGSRVSGGRLLFLGAQFTDSWVGFHSVRLDSGEIAFAHASFNSGRCEFSVHISGGALGVGNSYLLGGQMSFNHSNFEGGIVGFTGTQFLGGSMTFKQSRFSGGVVSFLGAEFSGTAVDLSEAAEWTVPPIGLGPPTPNGVTFPPPAEVS